MDVRLFHLSIPLVRAFANAAGGVVSRDVVLVELSDSGVSGWGEAAPFPGQDESVNTILDSATRKITTPTLRAALNEAKADLSARVHGRPLTIRSVDQPISLAVGLDQAVETVDEAVANGVDRFKMKIGPGRLDHVREVRDRYPAVVIGVDGNASFGTSQLAELVALADLNISYMEEPMGNWGGSAAGALARETGIPLFADEALRSVGDAEDLLTNDAVAGLTLKPGRLGWDGACETARLAEAAGKQWRASGLLETGIGRAFTDALASQPQAFVSDVAPASMFLVEDILGTERTPDGIGAAPDRSLVDKYLVNSVELPLNESEDQDRG